jgi:hypothetical protein
MENILQIYRDGTFKIVGNFYFTSMNLSRPIFSCGWRKKLVWKGVVLDIRYSHNLLIMCYMSEESYKGLNVKKTKAVK